MRPKFLRCGLQLTLTPRGATKSTRGLWPTPVPAAGLMAVGTPGPSLKTLMEKLVWAPNAKDWRPAATFVPQSLVTELLSKMTLMSVALSLRMKLTLPPLTVDRKKGV